MRSVFNEFFFWKSIVKTDRTFFSSIKGHLVGGLKILSLS
ncbi:unnamed protein product [Haemophilus parainfluenzae T3T1]|uniref:Uncharacterized protein n=1 Tax=Haemophilus parainfluenzae (strain T3T1) TaxID=862965 RepID=A0AB33QJF4_HAEP3|nr:unnamed protein product [Haemophilus parainfluenzae T3T1]